LFVFALISVKAGDPRLEVLGFCRPPGLPAWPLRNRDLLEPAPYGYLIIAGRTTVVGDASVNAGALAVDGTLTLRAALGIVALLIGVTP
jgi:hypothetical protein